MLVFGGRLFHRGTYSRDRYFNDIDFENDRVPFLISQCQKSSRIAKLSSFRCLRDTLSLIAAIRDEVAITAVPSRNARPDRRYLIPLLALLRLAQDRSAAPLVAYE